MRVDHGVYLSEFASPNRCGRCLKPTLEVIAGIPRVVLGYFARADHQPASLQC